MSSAVGFCDFIYKFFFFGRFAFLFYQELNNQSPLLHLVNIKEHFLKFGTLFMIGVLRQWVKLPWHL